MSDLHRFNPLKILAYADRLRAAADGQWPFPLDWHVYPSNLCNHRCTWCMFRQNGEQAQHPVQLPPELLQRAVSDAWDTGAKVVHFSGGGEPLINKHTLPAMRAAQSHGLSVALSTNGRLLTPDVAAEADYIRVSLNAGTKAQHDLTTNAGASSDWDEILKAIATSLPHRRRDLGVAFVVDQGNWRDIVPFCRLAAELGVDFAHIRPVFWFDPSRDLELRQLMRQILQQCNAAREMFGSQVPIFAITRMFDGYWSPRTYDECLAIRTGVCLTATGDFALCQDRMDLRFGGAYRDGKPFREIWGSDDHRSVAGSVTAGCELDRCPRCVWNARNNILHDVIRDDSMRLTMI